MTQENEKKKFALDTYVLIDLCLNGLMTDEGHHKQWYLEQILKKLIGEGGYVILRKRERDRDYEWEDGIPP